MFENVLLVFFSRLFGLSDTRYEFEPSLFGHPVYVSLSPSLSPFFSLRSRGTRVTGRATRIFNEVTVQLIRGREWFVTVAWPASIALSLLGFTRDSYWCSHPRSIENITFVWTRVFTVCESHTRGWCCVLNSVWKLAQTNYRTVCVRSSHWLFRVQSCERSLIEHLAGDLREKCMHTTRTRKLVPKHFYRLS